MKKVIKTKELTTGEMDIIFKGLNIVFRQARERGVKNKCVLIEKSQTKKINSYRLHFIDMSMENVKKAIVSKKLEDQILSI